MELLPGVYMAARECFSCGFVDVARSLFLHGFGEALGKFCVLSSLRYLAVWPPSSEPGGRFMREEKERARFAQLHVRMDIKDYSCRNDADHIQPMTFAKCFVTRRGSSCCGRKDNETYVSTADYDCAMSVSTLRPSQLLCILIPIRDHTAYWRLPPRIWPSSCASRYFASEVKATGKLYTA